MTTPVDQIKQKLSNDLHYQNVTDMPKRIQRKRVKGWKMPANTVYVGRRTRWGNPFNWTHYPIADQDQAKAKELAVFEFRQWLGGEGSGNEERRREILKHIGELRAKDLDRWCRPGESCHADVLLELANGED